MKEKKEVWSLLVIALMFCIAIYFNTVIPDDKAMIVHWNEMGEPDGYGTKFMGLFFFPIITLILYLIFCYIPRMAVYQRNITHFKTHYIGFKLAFNLYMLFIYITMLLPNIGVFVDITFLVVFGLATLIFYVGYVLQFTELNYFIGFRTPWTLVSPSVWDKTNHLASIVFRILAFFIFFSIFFKQYFIVSIIVPLIVAVVFLFTYSYYEYNRQVREGSIVWVYKSEETKTVKAKPVRKTKKKAVKRKPKKAKVSKKTKRKAKKVVKKKKVKKRK